MRLLLFFNVPQTCLSARPKLTPICFRQPLLRPLCNTAICPNPSHYLVIVSSQSTSSPSQRILAWLTSQYHLISGRFSSWLWRITKKKTQISLANHPLALKLENCHSVESITILLQDQARTFSEARGRDRITKSIRSTVSFLYKLSATAGLGDDLGLVRQKMLMAVFHVSDIVL